MFRNASAYIPLFTYFLGEENIPETRHGTLHIDQLETAPSQPRTHDPFGLAASGQSDMILPIYEDGQTEGVPVDPPRIELKLVCKGRKKQIRIWNKPFGTWNTHLQLPETRGTPRGRTTPSAAGRW